MHTLLSNAISLTKLLYHSLTKLRQLTSHLTLPARAARAAASTTHMRMHPPSTTLQRRCFAPVKSSDTLDRGSHVATQRPSPGTQCAPRHRGSASELIFALFY